MMLDIEKDKQGHTRTATDPRLLADVIRQVARSCVTFPDVNWTDAVSQGQLDSKLWLTDALTALDRPFGTAWVIGGWVGMLPLLLLSSIPDRFKRIITIDLDEEACRAADLLLRHHVIDGLRFAAVPGDAMTQDYRAPSVERISADGSRHSFRIGCQTIINTSWEHFDDPARWFDLVPPGKLVAIQANTNPDAEGHVSCPADLAELCDRTPFRERLVADQLAFGHHHRLMTIGIK